MTTGCSSRRRADRAGGVVAATGYRGLEPVVGYLDAPACRGPARRAAFARAWSAIRPAAGHLRYCGREAVRAARAVARESKRALIGGSLPSAQRAGAG